MVVVVVSSSCTEAPAQDPVAPGANASARSRCQRRSRPAGRPWLDAPIASSWPVMAVTYGRPSGAREDGLMLTEVMRHYRLAQEARLGHRPEIYRGE